MIEVIERYECICEGVTYTITKGLQINRLKIKSIYMYNSKKHADCICVCGTKVERVLIRHMLVGNTKSCGCYNSDVVIDRNYRHGRSSERLYMIWVEMRRRCYTDTVSNKKNYKNYGARGIDITPEWDDYLKFEHWALNNGYSNDLTIERKDNNKGYKPNNCEWIPKSQQSRNRRSNNYITLGTQTKTLSEWSRYLSIPRGTLYIWQQKGILEAKVKERKEEIKS